MITLTLTDSLLRIFAAVAAGLLIGFMRRRYPAGVRTFTLICLGSAIFTLISINGAFYGDETFDATRIISQVVTGIGFIGAGVIWKSNVKVGGLTTAAAIWTTASLGILLGLGEFVLAGVSLLIVLIVLASKHYLEE